MQVWADFLDLLRGTGEVVDFQNARQQIEKSLNEHKKASLSDMDSDVLIQALIDKGLSTEEIQLSLSNKN